MNVIFLDIDGVLISFDWGRLTKEAPFNTPDPRCVGWLNRAVDELFKAGKETRVVMCSTWVWVDSFEELSEWLVKKAGFTENRQLFVGDYLVPCEDKTHTSKLICATGKATSIKAWLEKHPEVTNWVVVDDEIRQFDGAGFGLKVIDTVDRDTGFDYRTYCAVMEALGR